MGTLRERQAHHPPCLGYRRGRLVVRGAAKLPLGGRGLPQCRQRPPVPGGTTLANPGPARKGSAPGVR